MFCRQLSTSCRAFRNCCCLSGTLGALISELAVDTILGIADGPDVSRESKTGMHWNVPLSSLATAEESVVL